MKSSRNGFTLVEVMTVVAFIGIIIAIALPAFFRSREISRMRSCQENLHKIDGAKQQWALDTQQPADAEPEWSDIIGFTAYLRKSPACPSAGEYTINPISEDPACSLSSKTPFSHTYDAAATAAENN